MTNRTGWVGELPAALVTGKNLLKCYIAYQIPGIGCFVGGKLHERHRVARVTTYACSWVFGMFWLLAIVYMSMLVGGNILSAAGLWTFDLRFVAIGVALSLSAVALDWTYDHLTPHAKAVVDDYIVVAGVHFGYLDRLPEFPDRLNKDLVELM